MPLQRYCRHSSCTSLAVPGSSMCAKHAAAAQKESRDIYERQRPSSSERGYGWRWKAYARRFLELHPVCEYCGSRPSELVDHVESAASNPGRFWDGANHKACCRSCHSRKTHEERALGLTRKRAA